MPRSETTKPATTELEVFNAEMVEADVTARDQLNRHLAVIDAQYGDNLPYDRTRIENETRFYLAQSAEAMLEAGKRFVLMKEHETHGDFMESLESLGVKPRFARKLMQASVKYSGSKRPLVASLGKTKMLDLLSEDDDDLEALAEGGTLAGVTLDEIEKMSPTELRKALREAKRAAKEDAEVQERILADKDKKINELDAKLAKRDSLPEAEKHADMEKALAAATQTVMGATLDLLRAISTICTDDTTPDHLRGACYHSLTRIRSRLQDIELDYNVSDMDMGGTDDDLDPTTGKPVWLSDKQ